MQGQSEANFVTITPRPIVRETLCEVCRGSIEQPKGKGRPRTTCSPACRKALSRAIKRLPSLAPVELFDLYNCPDSVLEVWHDKHKHGKMWPEGDSEGGIVRVEFRHQTLRLTPFLRRDLKVIAFHEVDLDLWKRKFPRQKPDPRKKKTVQLLDTDRNRDMESDNAKWDRDGGFSKDAEVAVANIFSYRDRDAEGEYNLRRDRTKFYADRLAKLVEQAKGNTQ